MMTDEERMKKIRKRTAEIKHQDSRKKQIFSEIACVAACFAIIICTGFYMPSLTQNLSFQNIQQTSATASIIAKNGALSYIRMGSLAFALGVCLTIFMYKIRERNKRDSKERDTDEF